MDRYSEAVKIVSKMTRGELCGLYRYLNQYALWRLKTPSRGDYDDMQFYISVMSDILGTDIRKRGRRHLVAWGRFIVMHQMLMDGWPTTLVGEAFGMQHAQAIYARERVDDMLSMPVTYEGEMFLYREFQKRIKNGRMYLESQPGRQAV